MSLRRHLSLAACLALAASSSACTLTDITGEKAAATASVGVPRSAPNAATRSPDYPKDDLALGKEHFRNEAYGLAELHFRRAVETSRGNAEAWLGLAASYDQLRRFDLADRAYVQAFKIAGPTPALLNNRGYSYLLRGDYAKASRDLAEAQAKDPSNARIQANLKALDGRARRRV
jgi:Flp pilus assembly protein TadD